jgi:hypothetical protein
MFTIANKFAIVNITDRAPTVAKGGGGIPAREITFTTPNKTPTFMKKAIICVICAFALAPLATSAQGDNLAGKPYTETTQSVSLTLPLGVGLHYAYEHPVARRATIIGRVSAEAGFGWGSGFFGDYHYLTIFPAIDIEPRFYYGLDRREAHGRSTAGNAGSFLALQVKNLMPFGYISSNRNIELTGGTMLTPMWGLRRVWADHFLFEFTTGPSFGWNWQGGFVASLWIGVRFGYSF